MITLNNKIPVSITMGGKNVETIKMGNEIVWGRVQEMFYIENTYAGSNVVTLTTTYAGTVDSSKYASSIQYSKDGLNWTNQTLSSTATISLSQGERVYFRGSQGVFNYYESSSVNNITKFSAQYSHKVGGNINSLLNYNNMYNVPLTQGCFESLFYGDTTLTSASDLYMPSTTLVEFCYDQLFMGCTSLTNSPQILAQTMAANCMRSMYRGCTSLVNPPSLPSTNLALHCYNKLFMDCTSLTTAPVLPATTMRASCYRQMFSGCSALTTAPELPAMSLVDSCYRQMFENCSSLVNPPDLPAQTINQNAYYQMFQGCSSLDHINVYANDNSASNCTYNWLSSVAPSGTFNNYGSATYSYPSTSGIPQGWASASQVNYFYVKNEYNGTNDITFRALGTPTATTIQQIEYSKDKTNWTTEAITTNKVITIPLSQGEKVYFRNDNGYFSNNLAEGNGKFRIKIRATQNHSIGGDITTLYNYSYSANVTMPEGCFRYLFGMDLQAYNNGKTYELNLNLIDASQLILPSFCLPLVNNKRTLPTGCYAGMFMLTRGLINPPQSIQCQGVGEESCHRMFKGSGITSTPELPATVIATNGYGEMFMACNSITSVPVLPATSVGENAYYYMFSNCENISGTVTLPATTPSKRAYTAMFNECPSLTTAIISATTLREKTLGMLFYKCSSMSDITVYATNINPSNMTFRGVAPNWVEGVSETGTFHNLGSLTIPSGKSGIPSGWTIVNS